MTAIIITAIILVIISFIACSIRSASAFERKVNRLNKEAKVYVYSTNKYKIAVKKVIEVTDAQCGLSRESYITNLFISDKLVCTKEYRPRYIKQKTGEEILKMITDDYLREDKFLIK